MLVFAVQVIRFRTCFGSCPREKATAQKRNVSPETVVSGPECFAARRSNLQSSPPTVTVSLAEAARSRPELVTSCLGRPHSRTTSRRLKAPVLSDVQRERGPIEYRKISCVMLFFEHPRRMLSPSLHARVGIYNWTSVLSFADIQQPQRQIASSYIVFQHHTHSISNGFGGIWRVSL